MCILITGGAGYIGSHTVVELVANGFDVVIVDNLSNSSKEVIARLEKITGKKIPFYKKDVCSKPALRKVFEAHKIDSVIHFAGLKSVNESVRKPLLYYRNNLDATLSLCEVMQEQGVKKLIFSSSATVYGSSDDLPFHEDVQTGLGIVNPYGQTKHMIEQILRDLVVSDPDWQVTALRYFNPIGAHESGLIGEDPNDVPNNLMPYVSQVAVGRLEVLYVFGNDYDTPDGTGIRDYIHVVDLAKGHVAALKNMRANGLVDVYNLGTGQGISVLELVRAFERASGRKIRYQIAARRPGDVVINFADPSRANRELQWFAEKTLEEACADTWRWQAQNPSGYSSAKVYRIA
jgi:UDP-glucose 4-epimerase